MNELIEKFVSIQQEAVQEKGPVTLFALIMRKPFPPLWDVVVAAPWITYSDTLMPGYIVDKMYQRLQKNELLQVSHVVWLEPTEPFVQEFLRSFQFSKGVNGTRRVENNYPEIGNCTIGDIEIHRAIVLSADTETLKTAERPLVEVK
jgi:hypothetical protein